MSYATEQVLTEIRNLREHLDREFPDEPDYSPFFWVGTLLEQVGALAKATGASPDGTARDYHMDMVNIAVLIVGAVECFDRQQKRGETE